MLVFLYTNISVKKIGKGDLEMSFFYLIDYLLFLGDILELE